MPRRKLSTREIRKRTKAGAYHDGSKALSAKRVQRLKGEGRYHDADVPGLYLQISASGARSWLLRYELLINRHEGQRRAHSAAGAMALGCLI